MFLKFNFIYCFLFSIFYLMLFSFILRFFPDYGEILKHSLPFEQTYSPSYFGLFLYLMPLLLVGVFHYVCKSRSNAIIWILFVSIFQAGVFQHILNADNYSYVLYLYLYFPIISIFYYAIFIFFRTKTRIESTQISRNKHYALLLIPILVFFINLIPTLFGKYPVGADVYFHATITENLDFHHPFFSEIQNVIYPKLGYYLIYTSKIFLDLDNLWIWSYIFPIFSFFIFLVIINILNNISIDRFGKILALLFIFPLAQFLIGDPSVRIVAYFLLLIQILLIQKKKNILALFILPLVFFIHYEIGIHSLIIGIFYIVLEKIILWKNKMNRESLSNMHDFIFEKLTYSSLLLGTVGIGLMSFLINSQYSLNTSLRNDIPLSLYSPVGVISLLSLVGYFLYFINNQIQKSHYLIISLSLLFTNIIFFYSNIWGLYHRYFFETAYIGISILSGYAYSRIFPEQSKYKYLFLILVFITVAFSILPRYNFMLSYAKNVNNFANAHNSVFNLVQKDDIRNKVFLIHPDSYINRYFPLLANNYIFGGNYYQFTNKTNTILSFCGGFDVRETCSERYRLLNRLFIEPNQENMIQIFEKYNADYLLLNEKESMKFLDSDMSHMLQRIDNNNEYILYKINGD